MTHDVMGLAGCRRYKRNKRTDTLTEIFVAIEQGIDCGDKYAVVCRDHATILGVPTLAHAHDAATDPTQFCDDCRIKIGMKEHTSHEYICHA